MMKRTLTLVSILSATLSANASSDWYIAPHAGIGLTNAYHFALEDSKPALGYDFGVNIRRRTGNWLFETGVGIMQSGVGIGGPWNLVDENNVPMGKYNGTLYLHFKHLYVPVKAGYTFRLSPKWSFVPTAGVKLAYNLNTRFVMRAEYSANNKSSTLSNEEFNKDYNRTCVFGEITLPFQLSVTSRIKLNGGPGFSYMITPIGKSGGGFGKQHNYMVMYNLGMTYKL